MLLYASMQNFWQQIPGPIIGLSPMDGVTDASFRFIAAKHGGPDVTLTEFVNIQSAIFAPDIMLKDFTYSEIERPIAAQIYGRTPELFYKVAHIVGALGFDGLDINMGCPAKKVAAAGCGAALIRTPELAREIIQAARQGILDWADGQTLEQIGIRPSAIAAFNAANRLRTGTDKQPVRRLMPLSIKTRTGYERNVIDEWIPTLLEEMPAAITLHGRTLQQGYKGDADWQAIARAAELAKGSGTLILGNGDLRDLADVIGAFATPKSMACWSAARRKEIPGCLPANNRPSRRCADWAPWRRSRRCRLEERFNVIREHSRHYENTSDPLLCRHAQTSDLVLPRFSRRRRNAHANGAPQQRRRSRSLSGELSPIPRGRLSGLCGAKPSRRNSGASLARTFRALRSILASTSPRRKEILGLLGLPFEVIAPQFDENVAPHRAIKDEVFDFALGKARSIAAHHPRSIVIGSDTMIALETEKIGKPTNIEDARRILRALAGKVHWIFTAVAIVDGLGGAGLTRVEASARQDAPVLRRRY